MARKLFGMFTIMVGLSGLLVAGVRFYLLVKPEDQLGLLFFIVASGITSFTLIVIGRVLLLRPAKQRRRHARGRRMTIQVLQVTHDEMGQIVRFFPDVCKFHWSGTGPVPQITIVLFRTYRDSGVSMMCVGCPERLNCSWGRQIPLA